MNVGLKGRWSVSEAKGHDYVFEQAIPGFEGRLPFVSFLDPQPMVCVTKVKLSEHLCMSQPVKEFTD
jgi:hypothetical protein